MGLLTYRRKRKFTDTPEPRGKSERAAGALRFVVQKHDASRLHYDFRLELGGVMKSWAVPKGPSLNPRDRRLAVMVEDHPLDYRTFEGTIPAGNYGAGTVMVWDEGTYHAVGADDRRATERQIQKGLEEGHLKFVLQGEKLRGAFALVRIKKGDAKSWLLMKAADEFATQEDVTAQDRSVITRRSMDEIARRVSRPARGESRHETNVPEPRDPDAAMPRKVKPMLATLVDQPFDREGWVFEPKWDGYRAIAEIRGKHVKLYSRNQKSFEAKFVPIVRALEEFGHDAVLDGEIVVVDDQGRSQFQLLQNYARHGTGRLLYYVFDILYLDGRDLRALPLVRRKEILATVVGNEGLVRPGEHVEGHGIALFEAARAHGLEGIIAKDGQSVYAEGARGRDWLKIKTHKRQEAVIAGFTEPRGSRKALGALILGVYEGDDLVYIGHTGGGLDGKGLADARARLEPLVRRACPFRTRPRANAPVHWVEPKLVCEITFQEWTESGIARQPIFVGFREDKAASEVHRELSGPIPEVKPSKAKPSKARSSGAKPARRARSGLALTNEEKVYWPDEGYTKGDLIAYYRRVAPVILPYLRDRPQSLHRHPDGITGESFFQKDVGRRPPPDWVETARIDSESNGGSIEYIVCQDENTLLYLANLGCIELNPWNSRVGSLDNPDYLAIDLDPEAIPFARVVDAALAVRRVLDGAGAECLCKTSGKSGLHIYVPLGAHYPYDQAKPFAEIVANLVHGLLPDSTSVVRSPARRQHRVYLDFLQNRRGQTLAAPYCVRPEPGATVSTPLKWSEVKRGLDPARFTIRSVPARIDKVGDLWAPVLGAGINLADCLDRLASRAPRAGGGRARARR